MPKTSPILLAAALPGALAAPALAQGCDPAAGTGYPPPTGNGSETPSQTPNSMAASAMGHERGVRP